MSGGKGGSETSQTQIPKWLEDPSKRAIERGEQIANIGYVPYMGPDVAAINPLQEAAMANTNSAASAFGMAGAANPMAGLPQAQNFGGVMGYSGFPIFEQAKAAHAAANPGQADYLASFFIDPVTGQRGANVNQGTGFMGSNPFGDFIFGSQSELGYDPVRGVWNAGRDVWRQR